MKTKEINGSPYHSSYSMSQKYIDHLVLERDRYLHRAQTAALQYCETGNEKYKRSALGLKQQYQKRANKIDNISQHLYGSIWCVAASFGKEKVEERRRQELAARIKWMIENNQLPNNIGFGGLDPIEYYHSKGIWRFYTGNSMDGHAFVYGPIKAPNLEVRPEYNYNSSTWYWVKR